MAPVGRRYEDRPARVLVVDDSPKTCPLICGLLARRGLTVVGEATSVASGLDSFERLVPDLVLIDVHLPDGSGFDLCARLRALHPEAVLLVTSACGDDAFYGIAASVGARGFVPKAELAGVDFSSFL